MAYILSKEKQRRVQCRVIAQAIKDYVKGLQPVRYRGDIDPHTYSKAEAWRWLNTVGKDIMLNRLDFPVTLVNKTLRNPVKLLEWAKVLDRI